MFDDETDRSFNNSFLIGPNNIDSFKPIELDQSSFTSKYKNLSSMRSFNKTSSVRNQKDSKFYI